MDWHRFFGLILFDFFTGSPFVVEPEKDLSLKKQFLDVVIVRKGEGTFNEPLPDGLENLTAHNLITFKSYQETLDDWALKELTGHYVNYRKQISPSMQELLPEEQFRLYAVSARFPQNLAQQSTWSKVQEGVYDCRRGTDVIRVLVSRQLPRSENNALLHLFSASEELVSYGADHYRIHSEDTSSLLTRLFHRYRQEGVSMSYTIQDFRRDYTREHLKDLTTEERLEGLSPTDVLKAMTPEKIVEALTPERIVEALTPERIVEALTPEQKAALLECLQNQPKE